MEEKTFVDDIDRSIYDIKNEEKDVYRLQEGLTPAIVQQMCIRDSCSGCPRNGNLLCVRLRGNQDQRRRKEI